jgi:cytidine deaminase
MSDQKIDFESLTKLAREVAERAYSPYSEVRVGAALLDSDGRVHVGCNVESASYGATICAERTALVAAIAQGVQSFAALSIWGSPQSRLMPCGICRQMLVEFAPDLPIEVSSAGAPPKRYSLGDLLPGAVMPGDLI